MTRGPGSAGWTSWPTRTPRSPSTCGLSRRHGTRPTCRRPAATPSPGSSSATSAAAATAASVNLSHRRPGDGRPVFRRERVDAVPEQQLDPLPGGLELVRGQPPAELGDQFPSGQRLLERPQRLQGGLREAAPAPLPEYGAQLVVLAEADTMIAAVEAPAAIGQQVADLAVGVVHHRVEDGHLPQRRMVVAAGERDDIDGFVRFDP